jgi:hypothetical protein
LVFNHEVLEASHLLVLSLEVAFKQFRYLAQLLFLGGRLLGDLVTHGVNILRDLLKTIHEGLLILTIAFNDLISLGYDCVHVS